MARSSVYEWVRGKEWLRALEKEITPKLKSVAFGPSPPNVFVGEHGYPAVRVGPLVALEEKVLDAPQELYGLNYPALLRNRALLARGFTIKNVKDETFLLAASQKSVDVEVTFEKTPRFSLSFSNYNQPLGPTAEMKKLDVVGNPTGQKKSRP